MRRIALIPLPLAALLAGCVNLAPGYQQPARAGPGQ